MPITISATDHPFAGESAITTFYIRANADGTTEITKHRKWAVCLYRDAEELGPWLTADVIGLPGVTSQGASRDEAISNVAEAIALRFEVEDEREIMKALRREYMMPAGSELVYVEQSLSIIA